MTMYKSGVSVGSAHRIVTADMKPDLKSGLIVFVSLKDLVKGDIIIIVDCPSAISTAGP